MSNDSEFEQKYESGDSQYHFIQNWSWGTAINEKRASSPRELDSYVFKTTTQINTNWTFLLGMGLGVDYQQNQETHLQEKAEHSKWSLSCGIPCHIKRERKNSVISPIQKMNNENLTIVFVILLVFYYIYSIVKF